MLMKHELVLDAITKSRPIGKLFNSTVGNLLDDYVVSDYVTTDNIPEIKLNGNHPAKLDAQSFFDKHQYLMPIEIGDTLKKFDFVNEYREQQVFPFEFIVHVFDTFIVIEIMPSSLKTEFVLLSPPNKTGDDVLGGIVGGLVAATSVAAIFYAISKEPRAEVGLYIKFGQLLEYLRTGLGKKKRFGFF